MRPFSATKRRTKNSHETPKEMPPGATGKGIQVLAERVKKSLRGRETCTYFETLSYKIFCVVIVRERGQHVVRQVRSTICQENDGIEECIH